MRYALWNNKGGVGKSFLSFILSTEIAHQSNRPVLVVDMCPQANLSEIVLGGNGKGAEHLEKLIHARTTIGGYFDTRIASPHNKTGKEADYLVQASKINENLPPRLYLIAGDPSLELQAQVINQIGGQALPVDAWKNVHNWLRDLISEGVKQLGKETIVFIDCNPSFAAYTEVSMAAADRIIVPCSSDGSSARAIDNLGALLYGITDGKDYGAASFNSKMKSNKMPLPKVHFVLLNRSTQYNEKASKAFAAMFGAIKERAEELRDASPSNFVDEKISFADIPDSHSVAIVCSHQGIPLYDLSPGQYEVHDETPQVNPEPLERYKKAVAKLLKQL